MKKIVFPFLCILMFTLSSCKNKGDDIQSYSWVPAIVGFDSEVTQQPTLTTPYGTYVVPELQSVFLYYLNVGDAVITTYTINYDRQSSEEYTVAEVLDWIKINKDVLQGTLGGESNAGDFDAPILSVQPYVRLGDVLFIFFNHSAPANQPFLYEMTYDYNEKSDIPTMYFRAKEIELDNSPKYTYPNAAAFELGAFLRAHADSESKARINIKFKTGEEDEKDVYSEYVNNPVTFDLSK